MFLFFVEVGTYIVYICVITITVGRPQRLLCFVFSDVCTFNLVLVEFILLNY
jgi:hypothetical protein